MDLQDESVQKVLLDAVYEGMIVVAGAQGGHLPPDDLKIKDDKTLVGGTDKRSEEAMMKFVRECLGEVHIYAEESGESGTGEIVLLKDPLDGTRSFANGMMSSTVILGVYNTTQKKVVGCIVGEAATGRMWSAFGDHPTRLEWSTRRISKCVDVWSGPLNDQSTVFLDVSHGFTRNGRTILNDHWIAEIFKELGSRVKLFLPGSNGLQQALVANGGQKVVGSITTAIGGYWDVCGVKLVLNAGGAARAFHAVETGDLYPARVFVERDPLDVMNFDLLVCGNSKMTVDSLVEWMPLPFSNQVL